MKNMASPRWGKCEQWFSNRVRSRSEPKFPSAPWSSGSLSLVLKSLERVAGCLTEHVPILACVRHCMDERWRERAFLVWLALNVSMLWGQKNKILMGCTKYFYRWPIYTPFVCLLVQVVCFCDYGGRFHWKTRWPIEYPEEEEAVYPIALLYRVSGIVTLHLHYI